MAGIYTTPGVHIEEIDALPEPLSAVPTSIPAFIGYTQKTGDEESDLTLQAVRIDSLPDFECHFGSGPEPILSFVPVPVPADGLAQPTVIMGGESYALQRSSPAWHLYRAVALYFLNGGGACYIVSVGQFTDGPDHVALLGGVSCLETEHDIGLVVVPDAVALPTLADCVTVQQAVLAHCAEHANRFAILDVYEGYRSRAEGRDCVAMFRGALGINHLRDGAAYYPWLCANLPAASAPGYRHLDSRSRQLLTDGIAGELGIPVAHDSATEDIDQRFRSLSTLYREFLHQARELVSLVPPSGAIAGVYVSVDKQRGVWKAPANISVNGIIRPSVSISNDDQQDLNVTSQGKSINAIRAFAGRGILVWGGRTLDGNNAEWRYISVRRTAGMIEASIQAGLEAFAFLPNNARTWDTVKSRIDAFLLQLWSEGGIMGARAEEAFFVRLGLGQTMTEQDMQQGRLRVHVGVALMRPAEFVVINLSLQMVRD